MGPAHVTGVGVGILGCAKREDYIWGMAAQVHVGLRVLVFRNSCKGCVGVHMLRAFSLQESAWAAAVDKRRSMPLPAMGSVHGRVWQRPRRGDLPALCKPRYSASSAQPRGFQWQLGDGRGLQWARGCLPDAAVLGRLGQPWRPKGEDG